MFASAVIVSTPADTLVDVACAGRATILLTMIDSAYLLVESLLLSLGLGVHNVLFVPSECLWQVHGLIFKSTTVLNTVIRVHSLWEMFRRHRKTFSPASLPLPFSLKDNQVVSACSSEDSGVSKCAGILVRVSVEIVAWIDLGLSFLAPCAPSPPHTRACAHTTHGWWREA